MILRGNFSSTVLCMSTNIQVFIPERYSGPYRVVYLLHGLHGDQGTWLDNTMLPLYAREHNAIFVMPEVGRSFYFNLKYGRRYFDYVCDELPEMTKKIFNISSRREDTAAIGCSMCGYGALRMALAKPELFGFCGAISPAALYFKPLLDGLRTTPEQYLKTGHEAQEIYKDLKCNYGDGLEYRRDYDIPEIAKDFPSDKPKPKIYSVCGTEDSLLPENQKFADEMKNTSFDFTYQEWTGGHDWYFFNEALKRIFELFCNREPS